MTVYVAVTHLLLLVLLVLPVIPLILLFLFVAVAMFVLRVMNGAARVASPFGPQETTRGTGEKTQQDEQGNETTQCGYEFHDTSFDVP
jgi:hypothetical protein